MPYRPTGAGAFGFSLNWEKVPGDKEVARRVILYLEDRRLLFGLGDYKGPVNVEIDWYGGPKQFFSAPTLDNYHDVTFGSSSTPMAHNP